MVSIKNCEASYLSDDLYIMVCFLFTDLSLDIPVQYHNIKITKGKENIDQPMCQLAGECMVV